MRIAPLATVPTGAGSDPAAYLAAHSHDPPYMLRLEAGDAIEVKHQAQNAPVRLRPYFWEPVSGSGAPTGGGRWVPLGGDGVSGTSGTTATPGTLNDCAHGRYQDSVSGGRYWLLHSETGVLADTAWASIEAGNRSSS